MRSEKVTIAGKTVEVFSTGFRIVIWFMDILTENEKNEAPEGLERIEFLWQMALSKAGKYGGEAYNCKAFGGGISFNYNIHEIEKLTSLFK